jgi:hypothetical protein
MRPHVTWQVKLAIAITALGLVGLGVTISWFITHSSTGKGTSRNSGGKSLGRLDGQVFIVTQGGENVKLGLVEVRVLPYDETTASIARTRPEAQREIEQLQSQLNAARNAVDSAVAKAKAASAEYVQRASDAAFNRMMATHDDAMSAENAFYSLQDRVRSWNPASTYFANLPTALTSATTDADGQFSVRIDRNGEFVLAAQDTRLVFGHTEEYYWLVAVSLGGSSSKKIFLSNDNLTTSDSKDSLLHAVE